MHAANSPRHQHLISTFGAWAYNRTGWVRIPGRLLWRKITTCILIESSASWFHTLRTQCGGAACEFLPNNVGLGSGNPLPELIEARDTLASMVRVRPTASLVVSLPGIARGLAFLLTFSNIIFFYPSACYIIYPWWHIWSFGCCQMYCVQWSCCV